MKLEVTGPLVVVTDVGESFGLDDAERITDALQQFLQTGRFLILIDGQAVKRFAPEARHHFGAHRRQHEAAVERAELGVIVVSTSTLLRGALAAISWLSGAFRQLHVLATSQEAIERTQSVLREQSVEVTLEMEAALSAFAEAASRRR